MLRSLFISDINGSLVSLRCISESTLRTITLDIRLVNIYVVSYDKDRSVQRDLALLKNLFGDFDDGDDDEQNITFDHNAKNHELLSLYDPTHISDDDKGHERQLLVYRLRLKTSTILNKFTRTGNLASFFTLHKFALVDNLTHVESDSVDTQIPSNVSFYIRAHAERISLDKHCWIWKKNASNRPVDITKVDSLETLGVRIVSPAEIERGEADIPWDMLYATDPRQLSLGCGATNFYDTGTAERVPSWQQHKLDLAKSATPVNNPKGDPIRQTALVLIDDMLDPSTLIKNIPRNVRPIVIRVNKLLKTLGQRCPITFQIPTMVQYRYRIGEFVKLALLVCAEAQVAVNAFLTGTQNVVSEAIMQSMLLVDNCLPLPRLAPRGNHTNNNKKKKNKKISSGIRGGRILESTEGLYDTGAISICDFSSYYPSLICADDLFFHTDGERCRVMDNSAANSIYSLLVKKRHTTNKDRKTALKLCCVGSYGSLLSKQSRVYCPRLAEAILTTGRNKLASARDFFGESQIDTVAGHTDSIIVKSEERQMIRRACRDFNTRFPEKTIRLEEEVTFDALFVINRVRYLGIKQSLSDERVSETIGKLSEVVSTLFDGILESKGDTIRILEAHARACRDISECIIDTQEHIKAPGSTMVTLGLAGNAISCALALLLGLRLTGRDDTRSLKAFKEMASTMRIPGTHKPSDQTGLDKELTLAPLWGRCSVIEMRGSSRTLSHKHLARFHERSSGYAVYSIDCVRLDKQTSEVLPWRDYCQLESKGQAQPYFASIMMRVAKMWEKCAVGSAPTELIATIFKQNMVPRDPTHKNVGGSTVPNGIHRSSNINIKQEKNNTRLPVGKVSRIDSKWPTCALAAITDQDESDSEIETEVITHFVENVLNNSRNEEDFNSKAQQLLMMADPIFWDSHLAQDVNEYTSNSISLLENPKSSRRQRIYNIIAQAVSRLFITFQQNLNVRTRKYVS